MVATTATKKTPKWADSMVLAELRAKPWTTPKQISLARKIPVPRVMDSLFRLQRLGQVARRGRGPYGHWAALQDGKVYGEDEETLLNSRLGFGGHYARLALPWPCPAPDVRPSPSFSIWQLNDQLRVQVHEGARRWLLAHLADRGHYHGPLPKMLRRTSHRGANRSREASPHSGSPSIEALSVMADICEISHEDAEAAVVSLHGMTPDKAIMGPWPKAVTPTWAWIAGFYFGCGSASYRERQVRPEWQKQTERTVRFRFDETVRARFERAMVEIGCSWSYSSYFNAAVPKYAGPTTQRGRVRRIALMPKPMWELLELAGLPMRGRLEHAAGRGKAARHIAKKIPDWCLRDDAMRHAFVEGYLNTTCAQVHWAGPTHGHRYARMRVSIIADEPRSRHAFADVVQAELHRADVQHVARYEGRGGRETSLHVTSHRDFTALVRNFEIFTQKALDAKQKGGHVLV